MKHYTVNEITIEIEVDTGKFEELFKITKENLKRIMFAKITYNPKEDITIYELSLVVKLMMSCSFESKITTNPTISIYDIDMYNLFVQEYNAILRHFDIDVYGNTKGD